MWLESEVGVGSTFGFSIPTRERASSSEAGEAGPLGRVVVIEDDRPSLDLFDVFLSGAALEVTTARDGQSGLEAVRRARPDAVVLDIRLPGIDGWTVLKTLKAEAETRDIPVVVVSIVEERARGAALGAAAYLVKPVGREELLAALARLGVATPNRATPNSTTGPTSGSSIGRIGGS
jgi:DNA-binding response OmpR family regulator